MSPGSHKLLALAVLLASAVACTGRVESVGPVTPLVEPTTVIGAPPRGPTSISLSTATEATPTRVSPTISSSATPPPPSAQPAASSSAPGVDVSGTVGGVATSARVILLTASDHGFDKVALTDATRIIDSSGQAATLQAITPGMQIDATGSPGENGALLAQRVQILRAQSPGLGSPRPAGPEESVARTS